MRTARKTASASRAEPAHTRSSNIIEYMYLLSRSEHPQAFWFHLVKEREWEEEAEEEAKKGCFVVWSKDQAWWAFDCWVSSHYIRSNLSVYWRFRCRRRCSWTHHPFSIPELLSSLTSLSRSACNEGGARHYFRWARVLRLWWPCKPNSIFWQTNVHLQWDFALRHHQLIIIAAPMTYPPHPMTTTTDRRTNVICLDLAVCCSLPADLIQLYVPSLLNTPREKGDKKNN